MILASDGLWDVLSNQEAVNLIKDIHVRQSAQKPYSSACLNFITDMTVAQTTVVPPLMIAVPINVLGHMFSGITSKLAEISVYLPALGAGCGESCQEADRRGLQPRQQ